MYFKWPNNRTILLDSFQYGTWSCMIYPFWLPQFVPSRILKTISLQLQYLWYFPQEGRIHHALKKKFTKNRSFVCLVISHTTHITPHRSWDIFIFLASADWLIKWVAEITLETTEYLIAEWNNHVTRIRSSKVDPEWVNCGNCVDTRDGTCFASMGRNAWHAIIGRVNIWYVRTWWMCW